MIDMYHIIIDYRAIRNWVIRTENRYAYRRKDNVIFLQIWFTIALAKTRNKRILEMKLMISLPR